jgi:hypothetical protein
VGQKEKRLEPLRNAEKWQRRNDCAGKGLFAGYSWFVANSPILKRSDLTRHGVEGLCYRSLYPLTDAGIARHRREEQSKGQHHVLNRLG